MVTRTGSVLALRLADALGEAGRDYFHRVSRFNSQYNNSECDKQYDNCLKIKQIRHYCKNLFLFCKRSQY